MPKAKTKKNDKRKLSKNVCYLRRHSILTNVEEITEDMPLAQAKEFLAVLADDIALMIDVIDNGEVE